jgi:hypothetical protein
LQKDPDLHISKEKHNKRMMDTIEREQTLKNIAEAHSLIEKHYRLDPAVPGSDVWLNKRRLLLADLALHLTDACVKEEMDNDKIKRYLHSILIIASDFAPEADLKETAQELSPEPTPSN